MIDANAAITLLEKRPEKVFRLFQVFSFFTHSVMAAFASIIISTLNYYCWTSITMEFTVILRPSITSTEHKEPTHT